MTTHSIPGLFQRKPNTQQTVYQLVLLSAALLSIFLYS